VDFFPTLGFLVGDGVPLLERWRLPGLQTQGSSHSQSESHSQSASSSALGLGDLAGDLAGVRLGVAWREGLAGVCERDRVGVLRALRGVGLAGLFTTSTSSSAAALTGVCFRDLGLDIINISANAPISLPLCLSPGRLLVYKGVFILLKQADLTKM
jgi:hypothetical protein